jgi:hypothetical protein
MGVGSVSIGTDTNQGFAGIGAVGFPPISGGNNKFYAYNPATQSWSTKAALPQPYRYQSLVFATSGKLYVLGGYNYYIDKIGPPIHYKAAYYKDFWQYDIGSDKWTKKNDLPIDSADFNKCVAMNIGEKGFLLLNNNMWEYNERNDQWDSKRDLPFATSTWSGQGFVRSGNYGMISESQKGYAHVDNAVWEYDLEKDEWKQILSLPIENRILFCIKQKGYYAKENAAQDSTYLWEFDLEKGTSRRKIGFNKIIGATTYLGVSYTLDGKGYFSTEYRSYMQEFYEFIP